MPNINDALLDLYDIQDFRDWYFWTCHLYYYSQKSLRVIGEKAGYTGQGENAIALGQYAGETGQSFLLRLGR